jgi:hypothetical protein
MAENRGQNMNNKLQFTSHERRATRDEFPIGSALIIAVILTSLLAIIGVMFIMIARVDKMATSAISENKELNFAVETVVAKVSQELVLDVPGVAGQEYYDYPDANNAWLANLEPYDDSGTYKWRRISDIYNRLDANDLPAEIIADYQQNIAEDVDADTDGDGVADSKWVELEDINSNKGKPIYAAVRVVDNGAMLNVNTAYKFDPNETDPNLIDGSSQLQINLEAFARGDADPDADTIGEFNVARGLSSTPGVLELSAYENGLIWRIEDPCSDYLPFDISDELTIHGRYIIKQKNTITRLKRVWEFAFDRSGGYTKERPYIDTDTDALRVWFEKSYRHPSDATIQQYYNMPHISTVYNIDRIITPDCNKMTNINTADVDALYSSVRRGLLDTNYPDANIAAQIAVNLVDYRDSDSDVTVYTNPDDSKTYYGFERPCIYISELAHIFKKDLVDPTIVYKSYAVELYKPYTTEDGDPAPDPANWYLVIDGSPTSIDWSMGSKHFWVIRFEDPNTPAPLLPVTFDSDPCYGHSPIPGYYSGHFNAGSVISLLRVVNGVGIVVDSNVVPLAGSPPGWLDTEDGVARSIQRDITLHKCIRRLWDSNTRVPPNLGNATNNYVDPNTQLIQAHPANKNFTNVGEIGMLFRKPAYYEDGQPIPLGVIGIDSHTEEEARLNLADPCYQSLFQYLTVFDPNSDGINNDGDRRADGTEIIDGDDLTATPEWKVPGRININTAPWYVLAQLPWVSQRKGGTDYSLAQAIVAYRDKLDLSSTGGPDYYRLGANNSRELETVINGLREEPGFASIGELATVVNNSNKDNYSMNYYTLGSEKDIDLPGFPDLTPDGPSPSDVAKDDFEERDVIFARISNLATVRSDVFTAYILVRIGTNGPQKRVIAILDRSGIIPNPDYPATSSVPYLGKVRIIALHPVPDPR